MSAARARGGQLVVENVALLSGGARSFEDRYKVTLSDDSFRKPGNHKVAHALLHFLLCSIDPDAAPNAFKPCFPIAERDQERDFRKVVDSRLSILERGKLLAPGVARRSTVSAAGGDKFEQLMWTLSTVALQQAALRHPAHATAHNLVPNPPQQGDSQNRRYAALLRARIASERAAFARTTQMGRDASLRWAAEIKQLRDHVELTDIRAAAVRAQLEKLGYDDRGVDLRAREIELLAAQREAVLGESTKSSPNKERANMEKSEVIKTSPVDSDESGSADEDQQQNAHVSDLDHLLAFSTNTSPSAKEAENIANRYQKGNNVSLGTDISSSFSSNSQPNACADVADLVLVAVQELGKATERLNLIATKGAFEASDISRDASLETDLNQQVANSKDVNASTLVDDVKKSISLHQAIAKSTDSLAEAASVAARDASQQSSELEKGVSEDSFVNVKDSQELASSLLALSRVSSKKHSPQWITDVDAINVISDQNLDDTDLFENDGGVENAQDDEAEPMSLEMAHSTEDRFASVQALNSKMDFLATVEDLQKAHQVVHTARHPHTRPKAKTRTSALRKSKSGTLSAALRRPSEDDIPFHQVPLSKIPKRKSNAKIVRFAELPPSYSASKARKAVSEPPLMEPPPESALDVKDDFEDLSEPGAAISALLARSRETIESRGLSDYRDARDAALKRRSSLTRYDNFTFKTEKVIHDSPDAELSGFRQKPMQRKPTPRHLATRRSLAIRNAGADKSDSSSDSTAKSSKSSRKNAAASSNGKLSSSEIVPLNDIPLDQSSQGKVTRALSLPTASQLQGVAPGSEASTIDSSVGPTSPVMTSNSSDMPQTPQISNASPSQTAPALGGVTHGTPQSSSYAITPPSGYQTLQTDEEENSGDDIQVQPRRSMSTPLMTARRANSTHAQASGGSSRLISFPSLYGRKKREEKQKAESRRSITDDDGFLSWLGSERKTGSFHPSTSRQQSGRAFRTQSTTFTPGRRSSIFSRKKGTPSPGPSSRRKKKKEGTTPPSNPKPNRVKALRDRMRALL